MERDSFDALLLWLDSDRDQAGEKYNAIQKRLIKYFSCRGRNDAEDLADETIIRVTKKVQEIAKEYVGDPLLYFYGVAQKVFLESTRKRPHVAPPPPVEKSEETEREYDCLDHCISELTPDKRELVLEYYQNDKRAKIEHRKALAERLGIGQNALRIRAHRIRLTLLQCFKVCIEQRQPA